jgi:homogentisate 1,2-dioxygenase
MPLYHKLDFPQKKHTIRKPNGGFITNNYLEPKDFHGFLSYHVHRPTQVKEILKSYSVEPKIAMVKHQIIITKRI